MVINNRYFLTHCFFSTKKKACEKGFLRGEVIFEGKIVDFSFKK